MRPWVCRWGLCLWLAAGACAPAGSAAPDLRQPAWPLPENPLEDDDEYDDLDDDPEPSLAPTDEAAVRRAYLALLQEGILAEHRWHTRDRLPELARSARVQVQADADAGISDGYTRFVVVPLDDQDTPLGTFYVTREGGFSGWIQWVGPFPMAISG